MIVSDNLLMGFKSEKKRMYSVGRGFNDLKILTFVNDFSG